MGEVEEKKTDRERMPPPVGTPVKEKGRNVEEKKAVILTPNSSYDRSRSRRKEREKDEKIEQMSRRIERLEGRMKLLEEESRGGIQIERFFSAPETPPPDPSS